jgi:class 3 adenylate cyclase
MTTRPSSASNNTLPSNISEADARFLVLRQSASPDAADALERLVRNAPDHKLSRVNVLDFAAQTGLDEERTIGAFLEASRIGVFDMSWNVLCPGCGGVLGANATLKAITRDKYECHVCAAGHRLTLDEMVEVTFTVSQRVRKIAAHNPEMLPISEYFRQIFWTTAIDLPDPFEEAFENAILDSVELPPGEKAVLSLPLPAGVVIVFEPVTHAAQFLDVRGEPTSERQHVSVVFNQVRAPSGATQLRPGPLRLSLENWANERVLPAVWLTGAAVHDLIGKRRPFLTAKRLLSNQTFRDIYGAGVLDVRQRFSITSLTFLFTDLKGSTALYERVGDLAAYDLVHAHFEGLTDIVASEGGAVVKTIGDAVMATFPSPHKAVSAALHMREAMDRLNDERKSDDILLKIGIHQGPCLAVNSNDRQDYFGQTVNVAARVQKLAVSRTIVASGSVVEDSQTSRLLENNNLQPVAKQAALWGISDALLVYEIP